MTTVLEFSRSRFAASAADTLVGRDSQLELLRRLRRAVPAMSVLLDGPAGVGKSRLARAAVEEAARDGWAALKIRGGSALFGDVPLAPWLTALNLPYEGSVPDLTVSIEDRLDGMRSGRGLVVFADDCHEIDEASVALLHRLVTAGSILAVMAARSDVPRSAALVRLTRGPLERVTLDDLSLVETNSLVSAMVGESLQDSDVHRIWHVTSGNPQYVREVVLSAIETGALQRIDGSWGLHGEWVGAGRLRAMVVARIGPLDPDERTAVDMLALAGALQREALPDGAVGRLETRNIVRVDRGEVTIAHPLHAEVLRCAISPLRRSLIRRKLVEAKTRRVALAS